jgi:hypothetical protein
VQQSREKSGVRMQAQVVRFERVDPVR